MPDPKLPAARSSAARAAPAARSSAARLGRWLVGLTAAIAGFGLAAVAGLAIAKTFTVRVLANAKVTNITDPSAITQHEAVVANSRGVALYTLTHDTIAHPGCTKANGCFAFWFPATVRSKNGKLTKPAGVKGTLRTFHRNGLNQLTLNNHPLYTFKLDKNKKGVAGGEGVASFGGVWHVAKASAAKVKTPTTTTTTTTTPYPTN